MSGVKKTEAVGWSAAAATAEIHLRVSNFLGEMEECWKPGVRLTFVARHPEVDSGEVIVTNDSFVELEKLMKSHAEKNS